MDVLKHKFIELRAEGYSYDAIAKELNKSKVTLIEWNKQFAEEIGNCKAFQLEVLYEKYFLLKQESLKLFGENLIKLESELSKRGFDSMSTEKLLELVPKYHALLKGEFVELNFDTVSEVNRNKQERQDLEALISQLGEN